MDSLLELFCDADAVRTGLGEKPVLPIRWVLIRDPKEKFKSQALLCTNLDTCNRQELR